MLGTLPTLFLSQNAPESLAIEIGTENVMKMYPARTLIDAGVKPILEPGDYSSYGPNGTWMHFMQAYITRKNVYDGKIWGPQERITRQEALWMATNWASRFYGDEKIMGTIQLGKLADMVVLGGDYMGVPEDKISEIRVLMTIVGGNVIFRRGT